MSHFQSCGTAATTSYESIYNRYKTKKDIMLKVGLSL